MTVSTKPKRNAVARALEMGMGGKSIDEMQKILRRPRPVNLGEDGLVWHCDELEDEEVDAILSEMEASRGAHRRNGLWYPQPEALRSN